MKSQLTCRSCREKALGCRGQRLCHGYAPSLLMRCWLAFRSWCK
jgi:hypothetical protein